MKVLRLKMKKLNELFTVTYGNKLDSNKMTPLSLAEGGVNFVGRSSQNHGVSGTVERLADIDPYPSGLITVALGGTKLLSSFIQEQPFYTAQNVAVLSPMFEMSFAEKLYMCLCIRHNRFRYSAFGREANRTLRTLLVPEPDEFPSWITSVDVDMFDRARKPVVDQTPPALDIPNWKPFELQELFEIKKGKRLTKANMTAGNTPHIGSTYFNNGLTSKIGQAAIHEGNTISVAYDGSVAEAFYQSEPFWASDAVNVLYPKFAMTPPMALFIATVIRQEKYRYNYGRKWHLERMRETAIKLPALKNGRPDFKFMEHYIQTLPYSAQI